MFQIDDRDVKRLERELKGFKDRAYPFATKATINRAAFAAREIAQDFIKGKMIQRNAFTVRSVQVETARTLNVRHQQAVVGSRADYMADQEFGATRAKQGKHGVPIPTSATSGEGPGVVPRRKVPRRGNQIQNMSVRRRAKAANRRQRNRIAIQEAAAAGGRNRFVFLDLGRRSGIYKVTGRKRKPKITKFYDLSRGTVTIPARPWLAPAVEKVQPLLQKFYGQALAIQLKRHGLFRG
jgi:hypothetical protein